MPPPPEHASPRDAAAGRLSVVATPIGNLADITQRALETLRAADTILAEDTRQTRKLLSHYQIAGRLQALHAHSSPSVIERWVDALAQGQKLALVTDAGTPLISDPGASLVALARERGLAVETIPGPSAVIAALSVCGLHFDSFRFVGFAPRSGQKRKDWLLQIARDAGASVFFESPARLLATLRELAPLFFGTRELAVCRELTKIHEEVVRGSVSELLAYFERGVRGEITVVVGAAPAAPAREALDGAALDARIRELLGRAMSARDVAHELARELDLPRREVYARVQALSRTG